MISARRDHDGTLRIDIFNFVCCTAVYLSVSAAASGEVCGQ